MAREPVRPSPQLVAPAEPQPEPEAADPVAEPPEPEKKKPKKLKDSLAEQTALAEKVKVESSPAKTLRLVEEYQRRFPEGFFGDRVHIRAIEAYCKLGQQRRANAEIAALRKRSAPLANRAQQRCADALDTKPQPSGHKGNR